MRTICQLGLLGVWTGEAREIEEHDGRPAGWVEAAAPEPAEGEFAIWSGSGWAISQTAPVVVVSFADLKAAALAAINAKVEAILSGGFTVPSGVMAGAVLQTRDSTDRINWLVSQASYSAAVAGGQGAVEGAKFRTADNDTFTVSYADGLDVLLAMAAWGAACMDNSWALKDAVAAAADQTALDGVDIEQGWPA